LNLLGDYGGGATYLAMGILAALLERQHSGCGQVVDAAIVDGVLSLMTPMYGTHAAGAFHDERGTNLLDSGVFFYDVYQCQDGLWLSVACLEEKFYRELLQRLEVDPATMPPREDRQRGEEGRARLARIFLGRTRAQWTALLEGTDVCFAPVLTLAEAPTHPHLAARQAFITVDGVPQPAPAPRFSRTPSPAPTGPRAGRFPSDALLDDWGTSLAALQQAGVVVP
jgi:crotonobetainyl-CoA:carnitine CoA-transferase CaiB-like acyl-CoA transferase